MKKGASQRPSKVIYDRACSILCAVKTGEYDWNSIFQGANWFHFTGITPALGKDMPAICEEAVKTARKMGLTVSCDLNYRKKLWSREEAKEIMSRLLPYVDVCIANEEDAADVFGIHAENTDIDTGKISKEGYIGVAQKICRQFGCKMTAITLRGSLSATDNNWGGMLYDGKNAFFLPHLFHPYCRPCGRRRQLWGRAYLLSALRLFISGSRGIRSGRLLSEAYHRT